MLNKVCLQGRLTRDPEMKTTQGGNAVVRFTLACDRDYVAKGQERQTDFIDCVAWRHSAKFICDYFSQGQMMLVTGMLQKRSYDDQNGNTRYVIEVVVDSVNFCGKNERIANVDTTTEVMDESTLLPFDVMG